MQIDQILTWMTSNQTLLLVCSSIILIPLLIFKFRTQFVRLFLQGFMKLYLVLVYEYDIYGKAAKYSHDWNLLQWNFLNFG